jgi:cysteinyl-tRNA synthetase
MNKDVTVDLIISVGDNKISVSMLEARKLFYTLKNMFEIESPIKYSEPITDIDNNIINTASDKQSSVEPEDEIVPSIGNLQDRINKRLAAQKGTITNRMDDANTRIDIARERAAERTRGCGSGGSTKSC